MHQIYLDYAATTPARQEVVAAVTEFMTASFGNPSSPHARGLAAETAVRRARELIAASLGVDPEEIYFTSGGTESNNLAIKGVARTLRRQPGTVVCSAIEHPSVLETVASLKEDGFLTGHLPVDQTGRVQIERLGEVINASTQLVSVAVVNNEIGTIQPIAELVQKVRELAPDAVIHTDAVQALGKVPLTPRAWGVDLLSVSGHKIGGPLGVGALYVRKGLRLSPLLNGGGQEGGLRSGTENLPGIVGFGIATQMAAEALADESVRLSGLLRTFCSAVQSEAPEVTVIGPPLGNGAPHILNLAFPGVKGEVMVRVLSEKGVFVSTGSACSSKRRMASHVLAAIGVPQHLRDGSLRISVGHATEEGDVSKAASAVIEAYQELLQWRKR